MATLSHSQCLSMLLLVLLVLLVEVAVVVDAGMQMRKGGPSAQRKKDDKAAPQKTDLPYISCHVCEEVVSRIYSAVEEERSKTSKRKVEEEKVIEILDNICRTDLPAGQWIRELDISEAKREGARYLALSSPGGISKCQEECATIERSCADLVNEDIDRDELSTMVWKGTLSLEKMQEKSCSKLTKRCTAKGKPKYLPKAFKRVDYPFEEISEKDLQMEQLMAQMKDSGLGGMSMYNREDMAAMAGMGEDGEGDEDDEDGEYTDRGEGDDLMQSQSTLSRDRLAKSTGDLAEEKKGEEKDQDF